MKFKYDIVPVCIMVSTEKQAEIDARKSERTSTQSKARESQRDQTSEISARDTRIAANKSAKENATGKEEEPDL